MSRARLLDHRRVDVDTDDATVPAHDLGDTAGDRAGAASDVEDREPGAQQRGEAAVIGRERAGVEDRGGASGMCARRRATSFDRSSPSVTMGGTEVRRATIEEYARRPREERMARVELTPGELADALKGASGAVLARRPAPKSWAATEVICHLRDNEEWFLERMKLVMTMDLPRSSPPTRTAGPRSASTSPTTPPRRSPRSRAGAARPRVLEEARPRRLGACRRPRGLGADGGRSTSSSR